MLKKLFNISPVWIVPIAALAIAAWIALDAYFEKGVSVQISFNNAHEIVPGQTLVKYKDVNVGTVKKIRLNKKLSQVLVTTEIDRDIARNLSENTRFWVVKPRISAAGISNLGTLISGVYIVMDPGEEGASKTRFEGLDRPPLIESDERGTSYLMQSKDLGHLDIGSPIYFRKIKVGEVTGYHLSEDHQFVDVNVFIRAPHDQMIRTDTRFWNVSGIGFSVGASGLKANIGSLASLINGGIEFENTSGFSNSDKAQPKHVFYLHPDKDTMLDGRFNIKYYYLMRFAGSVRGLGVGASVEYKGIRVGEVVDVALKSEEQSNKNLHVYVAIEPQRFDPDISPSREEVDKRLAIMVGEGLKAVIRTSSLLTGSKYIDLAVVNSEVNASIIDNKPQKKNAVTQLKRSENFSEIPTEEERSQQVVEQASLFVAKLNEIPYGKIGKELAESLGSLKEILNRLEKNKTVDKLDSSLEHLQITLVSANNTLNEASKNLKQLSGVVSPDSEIQYELNNMLRSVSNAAQAVETLSDELARNPNALIYGSQKEEQNK